MFRRPPPFEVTDPKKPFEHDKLGREEHVMNLVNMMKGTDTPLVMTLSAPWGSGKSSFVKMWKAQLELEGHQCILFDAWENDFNKEPLLACMGEINEFIEAHKEAASWYEAAKNGFTQCVKEVPCLLKASAGMASLLSMIVPGAGAVAVGLEACAGSVDKIKDYVAGGHTTVKNTVRTFKDGLREFVEAVSTKDKPLYFFVDELDRCEPEYAIRLLESVKHFFDVEGIVFVLSVDMAKLGSMARTRYGSEFDASGYLSRFVDAECSIPDPSHEKLIRYLAFDELRIREFEHFSSSMSEWFVEICCDCAKCMNASARDVYRVLVKLHPILRQRHTVGDTGQIEYEPAHTEFFMDTSTSKSGKVRIEGRAHWVPCSSSCERVFSNFFYVYVVLAFMRECCRKEFDALPYQFDVEKGGVRQSHLANSACYAFLFGIFGVYGAREDSRDLFWAFGQEMDIKSVLECLGTVLHAERDRVPFLEFYKRKLEAYEPVTSTVFFADDYVE